MASISVEEKIVNCAIGLILGTTAIIELYSFGVSSVVLDMNKGRNVDKDFVRLCSKLGVILCFAYSTGVLHTFACRYK